MGILGALRECRHHGVRFLQQAAVLAISRLVSNELLKMLEKRFRSNCGDSASDVFLSVMQRTEPSQEFVHIVRQSCHLEGGLVLLDPLQWLLEAGIDAAYRGTCRVCAGLLFLSVLLQCSERKIFKMTRYLQGIKDRKEKYIRYQRNYSFN